ncbi:unnamed protein product [Ilex paraguariensis]|uniref:BHLH domain-containing protein n=1 Tax=Ilex paraguariensis TaxID=185542 RepID=A0ABC8U9P8_9AQUA
MEPENLHHQHQLQGQLVGTSPFATPSFYGGGNAHDWTSNTIFVSNFNPYINGSIANSIRNLDPSLNSSMTQGLDFHWTKEGLSDDSYQKFNEMTNSPSSSIEDLHLQPPSSINNWQMYFNDLSEKLLLRRTFSYDSQVDRLQLEAGKFYSNSNPQYYYNLRPSPGIFSQIHPTINISGLNQLSSAISSSSDMRLQVLDLLSSGRFSESFSQPLHEHLGPFEDSLYGYDTMQELSHRPSNISSKISSSYTNGVIAEAKRSSSFLEPKAPQAAPPKKSRLESHSSCSPFKVRKEKLGDRIAGLQKLVAPFGKTDTASVLMEAIGYIKLLQNQVETLSVPYMKSSDINSSCITLQGGSKEEGTEEPNRDLRSRGLCLVPLSCLSYVTTDGGGGVWPPLNFG